MQIITKIYRNTKDKKGNEYKTKDGRGYERVSIQTQEYGNKWLSGFGADWNRNWKVGDQVNIAIEEKDGFINFSKVNETDLLTQRIEKLEKDFEILRKFLLTPASKTKIPPEIEYPEEEIDNESIPF